MANFEAYRAANFASLYIGFVFYMLCRKTFSFSMPAIMESEKLNKADLGMVSTSLSIAYTGSKFLGGLSSDYMSPKMLFIQGLVCTGLITIMFPLCSDVKIFCILSFLLGCLQGGGFPAFCKITRNWYSPHEFGIWSSLAATSINLACTVGPIIATTFISHFGWRYVFNLFGTLTLGWVGICIFTIMNKPEDLGFQAVTAQNIKSSNGKGEHPVYGQQTWKDLLTSPYFLSLCLCSPVVFGVRYTLAEWGQMYIIQDVGMSSAAGSAFLSAMEFGGIFGALLSGYISDKMIAASLSKGKQGSPRRTLTLIHMIMIMFLLHIMLSTFSKESSLAYVMLIGASLGINFYGCLALYNIIAQEAAPVHLAGTSHAIIDLTRNFGGILGGLPFTYMAKLYGWTSAFSMLECIMVPVIVIKIISMQFEYSFVRKESKVQH